MPAISPRPTLASGSRRAGLLRGGIDWSALQIAALAGASFDLYAFYSLTRHRQYLTAGYDLGIFDQAVRGYAHFHAPLVALKGVDYNILGDHFHPILAVLAPLYWVYDDPRTLLVAQAALVAASSVFVWRFAVRRFGTGPAALLTIGYLLGWPIQGMIDFDFHEIAFALPLLGWAIDAFDRRADRELIAAAGLLLLVREDMGAIVLVIGILRALSRRPRWCGVALALVGAVTFAVVVTLIVPHFAGGSYSYWDYPVLGSSVGSAVKTMLTHPLSVFVGFFLPIVKTMTLLVLLAPLLMLSLLSPISLIALPILIERFLSGRASLWSTEFHYNAPIWIIFALAAIDGLARVTRRFAGSARRMHLPLIVGGMICVFPVLMSTVWPATFPVARLVDGDALEWTSHMADERDAILSIPPGTCVVVDDRLAPHLTSTNRVAVPGVIGPSANYYILDFAELFPGAHSVGLTTGDVDRSIRASGYVPVRSFGQLVVYVAPWGLAASANCSSTG